MKALSKLAVLGALAIQPSAAEEPHRQLGAAAD